MLARLRPTLDFLPSPIPDKPGLMIRDPFQFSDATLVIPPVLVESLTYFDGTRSSLDLREHLVRLTGELDVGGLEQHLIETLSGAGFLEDENFFRKKDEVERAFASAPVREPVHAGSGYPDDRQELTSTLRQYLGEAATANGRVRAIAAPHVSPYGGVESYRAAYSALTPADADRTFVILGTSHYGEPDRFGLTRKPFVTPFGTAETSLTLVDEIERAAGAGALMEDYCHAVEHSIEFQVVFLQHLFGPNIRIVPVLCGAFSRADRDDGVKRTIGALGEIAAREGDRLLWVLGVDMAHMGVRYGDDDDRANLRNRAGYHFSGTASWCPGCSHRDGADPRGGGRPPEDRRRHSRRPERSRRAAAHSQCSRSERLRLGDRLSRARRREFSLSAQRCVHQGSPAA